MNTQVPNRFQTDNGSEFRAAIMVELCKKFGVKMSHGAVGHPQTKAGSLPGAAACLPALMEAPAGNSAMHCPLSSNVCHSAGRH